MVLKRFDITSLNHPWGHYVNVGKDDFYDYYLNSDKTVKITAETLESKAVI